MEIRAAMRKKHKTQIVLWVSVFLLFNIPVLQAFETDTHKLINRRVAKLDFNGFSFDNYLRDELGLVLGTDEYVQLNLRTNRTIVSLLEDGGEYEDNPPSFSIGICPRSANHFHNPITDSGFSGIWDIGWLCGGESSISWSQKSSATQIPGGWYSWHDARDYFYFALTDTAKLERESFYGATFRSLGQLMHLVQDLSVPEHARNDGHYLRAYEQWVAINSVGSDPLININAIEPIAFDKNLLGNNNPLAAVPFANLFDTNTYTGSNPETTKTIVDPQDQSPLPQTVGLSEYTNANFISPDTAFTEFSYPSLQHVERYYDPISNRHYLKSGTTTPGDTVEHLAAESLLYRWRETFFPGDTGYLPLELDPGCYKDYAEKLIPRAIGYSANLMEYFFRGKIDLVADPGGQGYVIENKSDEDMQGTFELFYDTEEDQRLPVPDQAFPVALSISSGQQSQPINFSPPINAKEPGKYILVFSGQLGNELPDETQGSRGAVIGKVVELKSVTIELRLGAYSILVDPISGNFKQGIIDDNLNIVDDSQWPFYTHLLDNWRAQRSETQIQTLDNVTPYNGYVPPSTQGVTCISPECPDVGDICPQSADASASSVYRPDKIDTWHIELLKVCDAFICNEECGSMGACGAGHRWSAIQSARTQETWSNNNRLANSYYTEVINGFRINVFNHLQSNTTTDHEAIKYYECTPCPSWYCQWNGASIQYSNSSDIYKEGWDTPWGTLLSDTETYADVRIRSGSGYSGGVLYSRGYMGGTPIYDSCDGYLAQPVGPVKDRRKIFRAVHWDDIIVIVLALTYQVQKADMVNHTYGDRINCSFLTYTRQPYYRDAKVIIAKRPGDHDTVDPNTLPEQTVLSESMKILIDKYEGTPTRLIKNLDTAFSIRMWENDS